MLTHTDAQLISLRVRTGRRTLGFLLLSFLVLPALGCQGVPWKLYRTINPYSKTQLPEPYAMTLRASGGGEFQVLKFYATKQLACMVLRAHSKNAYAEIYVNPSKARLVAGKIGIPALTSTSAARDPMFRRMVMDYYKLKDPKRVSRWSRYYFPRGTIPPRGERTGFLCFELARSENDPEALKLGRQCRVQLTELIVARSKIDLDWFYFAPMKTKK